MGAAELGQDGVELGVEEGEGVADERNDTSKNGRDSLTSGGKGKADEVVALEKSLGVELERRKGELGKGARLLCYIPRLQSGLQHQHQ